MATLRETAERHARDIIAGNMAALMGDFTPNGLSKAMALAANPMTATSFEIKELGNDELETTYSGPTGSRTIWSKWVQVGDRWQIDNLAERS